jgi:AcrR family transcriptional regulator
LICSGIDRFLFLCENKNERSFVFIKKEIMPTKSKDASTKGETTRAAIEDAAVELFMENGYHATSMRQIAERAGLALGGIYNYFSSKEELFEGIIVDKHPYKKVLPLILEAQGDTAEDFLKSAMQIVITELGREPYYLKLMMIEFVEFNGGHGAAMLKEIAPKVLPVFEQVIKVRKNLRTTNPAMLMRFFLGMVVSYCITEMVISNSVISTLMPKNAMDVYVDIFLHGILKPES